MLDNSTGTLQSNPLNPLVVIKTLRNFLAFLRRVGALESRFPRGTKRP